MWFVTKLRHFFIPHEENKYQAYALKAEFLLVLVVFLIGVLGFLRTLPILKPGILGISSSITKEEIIKLTNQKRQELGLYPLTENSLLAQAATNKALEMLSSGYWSHVSPRGKTPWEFIQNSGYQYISAGENLARDFSNSQSAIEAWMDSPSHRKNITEPNFKDVGVATVSGNLNGYQTTLVVQMFAQPELQALAQVPKKAGSQKEIANQNVIIPPLINQYRVSQLLFLSILSLLAVALLIDAWWATKTKILRVSSHSGAHFLVLGLSILFLIFAGSGAVI